MRASASPLAFFRLLPLGAVSLSAVPLTAVGCPSLNNFRDLAGTPCGPAATVRPGLVLRSATPAEASQADVDKILSTLPGLQVLDLRGAPDASLDEGSRLLAERTRHVEMLPKRAASKRLARHVLTDRLHVTLPLLPFRIMRSLPVPGVRYIGRKYMDKGVRRFLETIELADVYWWILNERGDALCQVLQEISAAAKASTPTLIHCAHGKDRTGVVVAVLLHVCGAELPTITSDYALSDEWGCSPTGQDIMMQAMPERYRERIREWNTDPEASAGAESDEDEEDEEEDEGAFFWAQFGKWCGADKSNMERVFARVEKKFGSMDGYLDHIGFDAAQRSELAATLTTAA